MVLKCRYFPFTPFSIYFACSPPWGRGGAVPHTPPHVYSKPDCQAYREQFSRVFICFLNRHLGHWHLLIISAYGSRSARASDSAIQHRIPQLKLNRAGNQRCNSLAATKSGIPYRKMARQNEATHGVEVTVTGGWGIVGLQ